jgi:hypothetical protein
MRFFNGLKVFGDVSFRGECPKEDAELRTFFSDMRNTHPMGNILKDVIFHVENEGKRIDGKKSKAKGGLVKGVSDIIGVGSPMLIIEMKRKDHTKSSYESGQENFLKMSHQAGCFVCVALGYEGAFLALDEWLKLDPLKLKAH